MMTSIFVQRRGLSRDDAGGGGGGKNGYFLMTSIVNDPIL